MTLTVLDRIFETTTSTGTGDMTLLGASAGFRPFSTAGNNAKVMYEISDADPTTGVATNWEIGIGTINATSNILSRNTVLSSTNGGPFVNFGTGTKNVFMPAAAKALVTRDENLAFNEGFGAGGGTANAQTVTFPVAPTNYSDGMDICYFATVANTGAMTVAANGLPAKTVKYKGGDIPAGTIQIGSVVWGKYRAATGFVELISPIPPSSGITTTKTANYTAVATDGFIPCDSSGGTFTITLPAPSTNANSSITIEKIDSTFVPVTITTPSGIIKPTSANTASSTLNSQGETLVLTSDGTNYIVRNRHIPSLWQAYTPASIQGFGTVSNIALYRRRVGDSLEIRGRFQAGTATAVEARVGITGASETITSSANISTIEQAGMGSRGSTSSFVDVLIEPSVNYMTFSTGSLSKANSGSVINNSEVLSIKAMIPINGWEG